MMGKILPGGGWLLSKGREAEKLGIHLGNSKFRDLVNTAEISIISGDEINMGLESGDPQPQKIKINFDVLL